MEDLLYSPQSLIFLFAICLLSIYLFIPRSTRTASHGPRAYPILGHLPHFIKNRHRFNDWIADSLAATPTSTLTFTRPRSRGIITANPSNVEHIVRSNFDNFPKGPRHRSLLQDFLGHGIFNADGPLWRSQRKTASFEFNTRSLRTFILTNVQHEIISRLIPLLTKSATHGHAIDLQDVLERFAFDNVCKVSFGVDPKCLDHDDEATSLSIGFAQAFQDATNYSAGRFRYVIPGFWKIKKLLGIGSERRLSEAISTVHDFALQIIRSRKKEMLSNLISSPQEEDLLSRFIASEDISEELLRDIVISFILAGRDTTSSALSWFFWLLSSRPEIVHKILAEIGSARRRKTSGVVFDFEELREMHYLHAAISEAMRLYPPVPVNSTACTKDDVLPDGTEVREGWFMLYNSYAMGRMEGVWGSDCMEYRPDRWLDEGGLFQPESPFKFPVFHGGPRMCLGKEMAYIQMKSIAACVIERFEVDVLGKDTHPEQMFSLTLRMKGGLPVRIRERQQAGIE